ncbi:MAG TPA: DUF2339 domain-containing protein [Pyrinomonadaceae bacterium]|nr:DUF2339 domain-containing protein [Pyrinomonadaceae bacterium]
MDDLFILIYVIMLLGFLVVTFVLPIVSLIIALRSKRKLHERLSRLEAAHGLTPRDQSAIQQLSARVQRLEELLSSGATPIREFTGPIEGALTLPATTIEQPATEQQPPPISAPTPPSPPAPPSSSLSAYDLESIIGRRWVGWIAVLLILFATAFFLKYAFDNRWIGEVGRVAIGIAAGVTMTLLGFKYLKRGWKIFSQILTGGGVVLLYLSTYAAFGYYHLVPQKAAFVFMAILIAEAAALALLYEAPAIAIMALLGGFLTPLLLHSNRDQYLSLFAYIIAIDIGALALLKHWRGLRTIAFLGSHLLFWLWYDEHYHHDKLAAVLTFQLALFLIFLTAHLVGRLLRRLHSTTLEDIWLLVINPFVFFASVYHLLNPSYHDWMGVFAILMALIYAAAAKLLLDRSTTSRVESLSLIGIALTFVTIAIPIQLRSNWITIAWSIEALAMLWAGIETRSLRLRASACLIFALAFLKQLLWDTPYGYRPAFIPIFNRYFLSSLVVIGCLFGAAALYQTLAKRKKVSGESLKFAFLLSAVVALWLVFSIETFTFFQGRALVQRLAEDARHQRWLGQMALSVVWAVYAAVLAAVGFLRRSSVTRWASLALFALTIVKAMFVDIAELQQLYRIIVFFVLGILLLLVAWGYHKAFHARESNS